MRAIAAAMVVMALNLSPLAALANPGGIPNGGNGGVGQGGGVNGSSHGGAPLPLIGAGIPGLAAAGLGYLIYRRKRPDKTQ